MPKAALPLNEADRLRTLQLYHVLDTAAEKTLDDLTSLVAAICETPISLISLVDDHRQWFKSKYGVNAAETPRDWAFCAHAILKKDELLIVEDATKDARFAENPLVTGDPFIRFYAGAPLVVTDGQPLGTLCVIDRKPRQLTPLQSRSLQIIRQAVVTQLECRRAQEDFRAVQALLPMCAWCRSVRVQDNQWRPLHSYVSDSVHVTHGICPQCEATMRAQM